MRIQATHISWVVPESENSPASGSANSSTPRKPSSINAALAALIEGCETELFNLTQEPENEDIFVMTTALPAQLRRKAEIMLDHMRDADAIYETNNK